MEQALALLDVLLTCLIVRALPDVIQAFRDSDAEQERSVQMMKQSDNLTLEDM